ncbi:Helix-turn-helix domain-containing protein [Cohnella sp. OV330]|uniref:helix-turn-helix domain-containing protein n=1 Tax=Cohnella sp. OV330 TaxID=1855288 RepID=UPI0008DFE9AB|nr:helix-turn-helix transcriptional regulator [Cohnella sp. OV330]SFA91120.1 Helix-turn-helix domain-containing protein [Cohnella sp. OV330]
MAGTANLFAERLKKTRQSRGMTQAQLGERIFQTRGAVSHYEGGRNQPDYDTLIRIANVLGVTLDYLLGRVDGHKEDFKAS